MKRKGSSESIVYDVPRVVWVDLSGLGVWVPGKNCRNDSVRNNLWYTSMTCEHKKMSLVCIYVFC